MGLGGRTGTVADVHMSVRVVVTEDGGAMVERGFVARIGPVVSATTPTDGMLGQLFYSPLAQSPLEPTPPPPAPPTLALDFSTLFPPGPDSGDLMDMGGMVSVLAPGTAVAATAMGDSPTEVLMRAERTLLSGMMGDTATTPITTDAREGAGEATAPQAFTRAGASASPAAAPAGPSVVAPSSSSLGGAGGSPGGSAGASPRAVQSPRGDRVPRVKLSIDASQRDYGYAAIQPWPGATAPTAAGATPGGDARAYGAIRGGVFHGVPGSAPAATGGGPPSFWWAQPLDPPSLAASAAVAPSATAVHRDGPSDGATNRSEAVAAPMTSPQPAWTTSSNSISAWDSLSLTESFRHNPNKRYAPTRTPVRTMTAVVFPVPSLLN
jgi:hypothetical protein